MEDTDLLDAGDIEEDVEDDPPPPDEDDEGLDALPPEDAGEGLLGADALLGPDEVRIIVVPRDQRVTSDIMTRGEATEVIGLRIAQLDLAAHVVFTNVDGLATNREKAIKELLDRRCPLSVRRAVAPFTYEIWDCNEMALPMNVEQL